MVVDILLLKNYNDGDDGGGENDEWLMTDYGEMVTKSSASCNDFDL